VKTITGFFVFLCVLGYGTAAVVRGAQDRAARLDACLTAGFAGDVELMDELRCEDFEESVVMARKRDLGLDDYGNPR
jgi:hypothetical protein